MTKKLYKSELVASPHPGSPDHQTIRLGVALTELPSLVRLHLM
jgi:hypothetical protein